MATISEGVALSAADLERCMAALIPRRDLARTRPIRDHEINEVQSLLTRAGKRSWSDRPQTYAVLRIIGSLDLMQAFVVEGLTDDRFPYNKESVPPDLSSDYEACELFLSKQWLVVGKMGGQEKTRRATVPGPTTKHGRSSKRSPPAELEDSFMNHFMGPTINITHENSKITFEPSRVEDIVEEEAVELNKTSLLDTPDRMSEAQKRPAGLSRDSSTISQPAHKKQERESISRTSSTAGQRVQAAEGRPTSRRESSTFSDSIELSRSTEHDIRKPSPARMATLDVQRPRASSRVNTTMSDPTSNHHFRRSRSVSPAVNPKTPSLPSSGMLTPRLSPEVDRQPSRLSEERSPPPHPRSNGRPISPGSESMYSLPDQDSVDPEKTRRHTMDNNGLGIVLKSRPSNASRTSSRNSSEKSISILSLPSSFLSNSSADSGRSRFSKIFTKHRPLIEAAKSGDAERVREVFRLNGESAMQGHDGKDNWTALHWAASIGASEVCLVLLGKHISTSARTKSQHREALYLAVQGGHVETVRILCEADCDVNAGSKIDGATALHRAALDGREDIVSVLVASGADVNLSDVEGMRPIHWAVQAKQLETVKALVSNGADLEVMSAAGLTPLHRAVSSRNVDMARLLLSLGSDVNAPSPVGNALNRADATGNGEMISLLSEHGGIREVRTDRRGAPRHFTGSYAHGHLD